MKPLILLLTLCSGCTYVTVNVHGSVDLDVLMAYIEHFQRKGSRCPREAVLKARKEIQYGKWSTGGLEQLARAVCNRERKPQ